MAAPAEDRESREHAHTGSENDRQELLRLVHVECPRELAPRPQGERSTNDFNLRSGEAGGKGGAKGGRSALGIWPARRDSNPRPTDPKSVALIH